MKFRDSNSCGGMPLISFFRSSKRSNKENLPQSKNVTKVPEQTSYIGPSPYAVVTQPKKHKGTRSCPGAPISDIPMRSRDQPFTDRHSQLNNSARYVNLPVRREETFDDGHYRRPPTQPPPRPIREERSYCEPRYEYESCESDDDEYIHDIRSKNDELTRENRKLREKCREYRRRMVEDAEYFKRTCERQQLAHQNLRKKLEKEQQRCAVAEHKNESFSRELHLSSQKIMDLEEKVAFFERSLDKNADNSGMDGAGEALCDQNDAFSRELLSSDTPSVSMFADGRLDQDKDEIRIFHSQDSDDEEQDDTSTPEVEVERSMRASPIELALDTSPPLYNTSPGKIGRSLSDTDVQSLASAVANITVAKTSTLDRTPHYRVRLKDMPMSRRRDSPSFSSTSEEDETAFQQQQYEKQLRKIGDAVKYKPPRKQIEEKYYRRFGKPERAAIDELNFLNDMSSDASGLLSSPDVVVQNSRLFKK